MKWQGEWYQWKSSRDHWGITGFQKSNQVPSRYLCFLFPCPEEIIYHRGMSGIFLFITWYPFHLHVIISSLGICISNLLCRVVAESDADDKSTQRPHSNGRKCSWKNGGIGIHSSALARHTLHILRHSEMKAFVARRGHHSKSIIQSVSSFMLILV